MDTILEINNLRKTYRDFVLDGISFSLQRGFIMGFIGPNGAGKSTTIKLIMNLVGREGGEIKLFGLDSLREEKKVKQRIGFVYDENYYYEDLSPKEIKRIIAPFYKAWDNEVFEHYLKAFGLPAGKKIKEFSKGMKMKFSIVTALSHGAELIILDEPTSGLDPIFRREILDILAECIQDGKTSVLFSTHITSDLDRTADYITFIDNGRLVFSEERDSILERYALVKGSSELLDQETKKMFVGIRKNPYGFEALTAEAQKARRLFREQAVIEKATLEDVILYTVKGESA